MGSLPKLRGIRRKVQRAHLQQKIAALAETDKLPWGQKARARRSILNQCIRAILPAIDNQKCTNWYAHCFNFYPMALSLTDL